MNDKFFDIAKEKQDRMINASFEVFAGAGYLHASTDDIVSKAGISKGLLFHYFTSKLGLYAFLYDYAMKYEQLELSTSCRDESDYFTLRSKILRAQVRCMRSYPYLILFLDSADRDADPQAAEAVGMQILLRAGQLRSLYGGVDMALFRREADVTMIGRMLNGAFHTILQDAVRLGDRAPDEYLATADAYLVMMRKLCYVE